MNATVNQELRPGSVVRLRFQVPANELLRTYRKIQDKYQRQIQLPGFRRGKAPIELIEKKLGSALKAEAVQEVVQEVLAEYLPKAPHQPVPFDQPRLVDSDLSLELDRDLTFHVEYDTYPEFTVSEWTGLEIEAPQVEVTDQDVQERLEKLREENAIVVTKSEGGAAEGDVVTLDFCELDERGAVIPGTERQDFVMTLGKGQSLYDFDRELAGLREGEERTFTKDYSSDYKYPELAGSTRHLQVRVKALKTLKLPELDDDFAQDISDRFQTLDDLKADIRRQLQEALEERLMDVQIEALLDKMLERTGIDLPRSMVEYQLQRTWERMAQSYRLSVEDLERVMGQERRQRILEGWQPQAERQLRRELLLQKIEEGLGYQPTEEEVQQELHRLAERYHMGVDKVTAYYEQNKMMDTLRKDLVRRHTVRTLLAGCKIRKGKRIAYRDFIDGDAQKGHN